MARVRLRVLLLIAANLPLLCAELSGTAKSSSNSGRDKAKPASCGKDCEVGTRKRSTQGAKCELYYFAPTASDGKLFASWNTTKVEQLLAYNKIVPFLQENRHEDKPIYFPAHMPLVQIDLDGYEYLDLKDVYVRAKGTCGDFPKEDDPDYFNTDPSWYSNTDLKLEMVEHYVERMPRSHWGYRVPKAGENDVCLDDTGLVVKDFPGIRTCFSMWIYDDFDRYPTPKPKYFAGRQIYNRVNQTLAVKIATIGFDPSTGGSLVEPTSTEWFSLPALFLKEMCHVTNASLENRCTYWITEGFYVSLCCCYTNRTDCAYKTYKFPSQQKADDPVIRACATGEYYLLESFGGNRHPKNASEINQFVRERTSSEVCKWTYTWDPSNKTEDSRVLRVELDAEKPEAFTKWVQDCTLLAMRTPGRCCQRTATLCPLDPKQDSYEIAVECFCRDGDLCNKQHSSLDMDVELFRTQVRKFKEARPCDTHTVFEHLLWGTSVYKKNGTDLRHRYMCPVFYNFAHLGRPNTFLHLLNLNNFKFVDGLDWKLFEQHGCTLVEVEITEVGNCTEKLFGEHDNSLSEVHLILLCSVEGNPLGERRPSYPDADLKKTIQRNLTAAKADYPKCKSDSLSMSFKDLSELVVNNSKLFDLYDDMKIGTNDNITTAHCYVGVSFVYQQQYNFTFGAVSIDDKSLHDSCRAGVGRTCVRRNSTAAVGEQHFDCCCRRHWNQRQDICRNVLLGQLKTLLNENAIAETPEKIMSELKKDPLTKCDQAETSNEGHDRTDINRPCARNEGCYAGVHARDVPTNSQHKDYGGCVSDYAPEAKKRYDSTSDEVEARFSRICRLPINQGECFAVLSNEDAALPDDVKGPQMVCCCGGRVATAQKCSTGDQFGMKIGDFL
ncbi:hypothetical protein AAVH_11013 [Aphelenchoides avenae]|nr:hypothetical protein AAVH_11013 [Aphelenchus avenae]